MPSGLLTPDGVNNNVGVPQKTGLLTPDGVNTAYAGPQTPQGDSKLNTPTQPSTSTTIVGSGLAADKVNNVIVPAMNQGKQDIINQNIKNNSNSAGTNNQGIPYTPSSDAQANSNAANSYNGTSAPPINNPENTPGTPEHTILNTPSAGHQFIYDNTGNRLELPIGQDIPQGYSTIQPPNPQTQVATNTATQTNGTVIKQFADGTYGSFDATGKYQGPASSDQFNQAQNANSLLNSINQLVNGTYPLTAPQQAEVTALQQSFQQLIKQQEVANANFTGGTTVAENLYGMGNSIAGLGEIKGTVDSGLQKVADLNGKMTSAVSQMIDAFQKDNLALLKTAYDLYSSAQQDRQNEIDKLKSAAQAKLESDRNYNLQVQNQKDTEANNLRTYNLELQKEKDQTNQFAINSSREEKLANSTVALQKSEIYKNSLDAQKTKAEIAALINPTGGVPGVSLNSVGIPSISEQKAYLENIAKTNPGLALQVKAAAEYKLDPTKLLSIRGNAREQFDALVRGYDPNYDSANYKARADYIKNLASGQLSQGIVAANKSVNHISSLMDSLSKLGNHNFGGKFVNDIGNWFEAPFSGNKQEYISKVETEAHGVASELEKFFKGVGVTDVSGIESWQKQITPGASPAMQKGFKDGALTLLTGQLDSMYAQYRSNTGQNPPIGKILQPETLTKLKNMGVDITPYISGTPTGIVQNAAQNGTPDQKALISQMVKDGKTDEDIATVLGE